MPGPWDVVSVTPAQGDPWAVVDPQQQAVQQFEQQQRQIFANATPGAASRGIGVQGGIAGGTTQPGGPRNYMGRDGQQHTINVAPGSQALAEARYGASGPVGQGQAMGSQPWGLTDQLVSSLGASDEMGGAIDYAAQGGRNIARQLRGQPLEMSAADAYHAGSQRVQQGRQRFAQEHPAQDALASALGFLTAGAPNATAGMTATAPSTLGRALQTGSRAAVANTPYALARAEGTPAQRVPQALESDAAAFGGGAALQGAFEGMGTLAQHLAANPSPARQLSNAGVDALTPGQMTGGIGRRVENGLRSMPFVGDSIIGAQNRSIESLDRAAFNQALAPINETLPRNVNMGTDAMTTADALRSAAYRRALNGVTIQPDQPLITALSQARTGRALPPQAQASLDSVFTNSIVPRLTQPGGISGNEFQQLDSELGAMQRSASSASAQAPENRYLADALGQARTGLLDAFDRQDPTNAQAYERARQTAATLMRLRDASQGVGTESRNGVFTPGDLSRAVRNGDASAGNQDFTHGDALLQNLSRPAARVLPSNVADSGTPFRMMLNTAAAGLGGGAVASGHGGEAGLAAGLGGATMALYSPPVQAAINAVYRATNPAQAAEGLSVLAREAARNPQLAGVYQAALLRVHQPSPQGAPQQGQAVPTGTP